MTLDQFDKYCTDKGIKWKYCKGHLGARGEAKADPHHKHLIAISIYIPNPYNDNKPEWVGLSSLAPTELAIQHAVDYISART